MPILGGVGSARLNDAGAPSNRFSYGAELNTQYWRRYHRDTAVS